MSWRMRRALGLDVTFAVPEIVGKARPRHNGKTGITYTPYKTRKAEQIVRSAVGQAIGARKYLAGFTGPVSLRVEVTRELARSNPKFWAGRKDLGKPDWDNIGKLVCDALNGVAYKDDQQVFRAEVVKLPRVPHGHGNSLRVCLDYYQEIFEKENR